MTSPSSTPAPAESSFELNGKTIHVDAMDAGRSLLETLREQCGMTSVKDGCAPQGQCGCCTVLVDGEARVSCVTATSRVFGRSVVTVEGLEPDRKDALANAFVACGASQCGFCTPGIAMRLAPLLGTQPSSTTVNNALAAHMCRCTGWQPIVEAFTAAECEMLSTTDPAAAGGLAKQQPAPRENAAVAAAQSALEWNVQQPCDRRNIEGTIAFADDDAPLDALVAVPTMLDLPDAIEAAGMRWILAPTRAEARRIAGHTQGRKTTEEPRPPIDVPTEGTIRLATCWVDSGYLEPDASWCVPGGEPASPRRFGGAFGGKAGSPLPEAARALADKVGQPVRALWSREDVARYAVKRPPMAAQAELVDQVVAVRGMVAAPAAATFRSLLSKITLPYALDVHANWDEVALVGPPVSPMIRAAGLAELWVLVEALLDEAGRDRRVLVNDPIASSVLLDTCAPSKSGALAGARVTLNAVGALDHVEVRVAAGRPIDPRILRSYCIGAVHAALGWTLSESMVVDPLTGEVKTLTIRGLGQLRPKDMPTVEITIVEDDRDACAAGDAVFAAVAAATWNAVTKFSGERPVIFPMRDSAAGRPLRR